MPIYTVETSYHGNYKCWYKNDKYHRDGNLPAAEWIGGDKYWYKNDLLHRDDDLPAIEWFYGDKFWFKNDIEYYPINQLISINMIKIKIIKMGNKWWYANL